LQIKPTKVLDWDSSDARIKGFKEEKLKKIIGWENQENKI
jgi:hypothetical protein